MIFVVFDINVRVHCFCKLSSFYVFSGRIFLSSLIAQRGLYGTVQCRAVHIVLYYLVDTIQGGQYGVPTSSDYILK